MNKQIDANNAINADGKGSPFIYVERAPHLQTPTQASIPASHPKNRWNNRKAPASPHTTWAVGADREGHPGKVNVRGGGGRVEEVSGAGVHWYLTAKGAKTAKDSTALALRPL